MTDEIFTGQDIVGCETTLFKGGSQGGNRYRLGVRSAVIFGDRDSQDWSPEQVAEFFRTLYKWRNKVVHSDVDEPHRGLLRFRFACRSMCTPMVNTKWRGAPEHLREPRLAAATVALASEVTQKAT